MKVSTVYSGYDSTGIRWQWQTVWEKAVLWAERGLLSGLETLPLLFQNKKSKRASAVHIIYGCLKFEWVPSWCLYTVHYLTPFLESNSIFLSSILSSFYPYRPTPFISLSKIRALTQTFRRWTTFLFRFLVAEFCFMLLSLAFGSSRRFKTFFTFSVLSFSDLHLLHSRCVIYCRTAKWIFLM
jgi:hypothetical protein